MASRRQSAKSKACRRRQRQARCPPRPPPFLSSCFFLCLSVRMVGVAMRVGHVAGRGLGAMRRGSSRRCCHTPAMRVGPSLDFCLDKTKKKIRVQINPYRVVDKEIRVETYPQGARQLRRAAASARCPLLCEPSPGLPRAFLLPSHEEKHWLPIQDCILKVDYKG